MEKHNGHRRGSAFLAEVIQATPGGERIVHCLQCGSCGGSCPSGPDMDHTPRTIFAMINADRRDAVLRSNTMWFCVSCYSCTVRCPQQIPITEVMYALKRIAIAEGKVTDNDAPAHDLAALSLKEGFSTITMQLTRSLFPEDLPVAKKSLARKVCEVYLAGKIEREFTKREILNLYLNQIILARGIYGVEMASQYYFGKPVKQVSTAEAALLVGLNRNAGLYNPRTNTWPM